MKETTQKSFHDDCPQKVFDDAVREMEAKNWSLTSTQFHMVVLTFEREIPEPPNTEETCEDCNRDCGKRTPPPTTTSGDPGYANDEHPADYGGLD